MPFKKGKGKKAAKRNIAEFHKGKMFKKTKAKFGKKVADRQAVAAGMAGAGMARNATRRAPTEAGEGAMERYAKRRAKA